MKHVRKALILMVTSATMVLVSASVAMAGNDYPPVTDRDDPGRLITPGTVPGAAATGDQSGQLALTGSDLTLVWVGLAVLVVGVVFFVATRRRATLRRQSALRIS